MRARSFFILSLLMNIGEISYATTTTTGGYVTTVQPTTTPGHISMNTTGTVAGSTTDRFGSTTDRFGSTADSSGSTTDSSGSTTDSAGSTVNATTGAATGTTKTGTVAPAPIRYSFQVNDSRGDVCMLLVFNATMTVQYDTYDRGYLETTIPVASASSFEGVCNGTSHNFTLWYPALDLFCAVLTLIFTVNDDTTYSFQGGMAVRFIEPCFQPDTTRYDEIVKGIIPGMHYEGTIGKSYECSQLKHTQTHLTVVMDDVVFQPFATKSSDEGHFGEVEVCKPSLPTTKRPGTPTPNINPPHTKPPPNNTGMIVGIVLGSLAVVAIIIGVAVYVVRKNRQKEVLYHNM